MGQNLPWTFSLWTRSGVCFVWYSPIFQRSGWKVIFIHLHGSVCRNVRLGWAWTACAGLSEDIQSSSRDGPGQKERELCGLDWPQWLPVWFPRSSHSLGHTRRWRDWSQCPGTPQLQPHPIPSALLAAPETEHSVVWKEEPQSSKADLQWSCR